MGRSQRQESKGQGQEPKGRKGGQRHKPKRRGAKAEAKSQEGRGQGQTPETGRQRAREQAAGNWASGRRCTLYKQHDRGITCRAPSSCRVPT